METAESLMLLAATALERSYEWLSQVDALQSQNQRSLLSTEDLKATCVLFSISYSCIVLTLDLGVSGRVLIG